MARNVDRVVIRHGGRILLVRNRRGSGQWTLPGGGIEWLESPEHAARREVVEEAGIRLDEIRPIGTLTNHKGELAHCFVADVRTDRTVIDPVEIAEAGWWDEKALPVAASPFVAQLLA